MSLLFKTSQIVIELSSCSLKDKLLVSLHLSHYDSILLKPNGLFSVFFCPDLFKVCARSFLQKHSGIFLPNLQIWAFFGIYGYSFSVSFALCDSFSWPEIITWNQFQKLRHLKHTFLGIIKPILAFLQVICP